MTPLWQEVSRVVPNGQQMVRVGLRLFAALIVGTVIGFQREVSRKPAGLRTHLLVALGSALLVIAAENAGINSNGVARVIQGLVTGIGFLGGGTILKLTREHEIRGLTTAAGIWLTAAASIAVGLGDFGDAFIGVLFAIIVLTVVGKFEGRLADRGRSQSTDRHGL